MIVLEGKIILKLFLILIPDPENSTHLFTRLLSWCASAKTSRLFLMQFIPLSSFVTAVLSLASLHTEVSLHLEKGTVYFRENDHPCKIKLSYSGTEACFEKGALSRKCRRQFSVLSVYILISQPLSVPFL